MDKKYISETQGERLFQEYIDQCQQRGIRVAFDSEQIRAMVRCYYLKRQGLRCVPDRLMEVGSYG